MGTEKINNKLMDDSVLAVFDALKYDIFDITPNFKYGMDWYPIFCELRAQGVLGFSTKTLEYVLKNGIFVPDEKSATLADTWKKRIQQQRERAELVGQKQNILVELLQENGEKFVILKGLAAASLYNDYSSRKPGDVDFLVYPNRFDDIHRILIDNGFECIENSNDRHNVYVFDGVEFEMHRKFSFDNTPISKGKTVDERFFENLDCPELLNVDGFSFPSLSPQNIGICILVHLATHLVDSGFGFRHFLDWVMFADHYLSDEQWNNGFCTIADELGVAALASVMTKTAQKYFGLSTENRTWCSYVNDNTCEDLVMYMLEKGNYGVKEPDTAKFFSTMYNLDTKHGIIATLQCRGEKNWTALDKHHYLRPFAWLYQITRYIRKSAEIKNPCVQFLHARTQRKKLETLIRDCGLNNN